MLVLIYNESRSMRGALEGVAGGPHVACQIQRLTVSLSLIDSRLLCRDGFRSEGSKIQVLM